MATAATLQQPVSATCCATFSPPAGTIDRESSIALFNLLEEIVIRRTRPFIKATYPNATINGKPITWPDRKLKTVRYNLEATYGGIYDRIVHHIESLRLAPYRLETYKKKGIERDEFEEGREEALVGIFKSRYLKRFESSVDAFRISVRRALEFLETFESYVLDGRVLDSASFQKALRLIAREDEEDDATPGSRSDDLDASAEARQFIAQLPPLDAAQYDLKRLHADLRKDVDALREVWHDIANITPERDAKLEELKRLLAGDLRGRKVLVFSYYKDTARYIYRNLAADTPEVEQWRAEAGNPRIRRMDSGADARERARLVAEFAPVANHRPEIAGTSDEIDILISTDVLSEGQNLQDCGALINYDLHWNPTRMVQRAGRDRPHRHELCDALGDEHVPRCGVGAAARSGRKPPRKIAAIDLQGFLDAERPRRSSASPQLQHPAAYRTGRRQSGGRRGAVHRTREQRIHVANAEEPARYWSAADTRRATRWHP